MHNEEILIPLTIFAGGFAMVFGIVYLRTKQNMAMIEKGMNPKNRDVRHRPTPYLNLKWGLLLVGSGLGLFLAYMLDNFVLYKVGHTGNEFNDNDANIPIYFALIAIGGGLGLITSYRIEKKELLDKEERGSLETR